MADAPAQPAERSAPEQSPERDEDIARALWTQALENSL
jgi:hypothetical protein